MEVGYSKKFRKQYARLSPKFKQKATERILLWQKNPGDPTLHDHALQRKYKSYRSIDITGDLRALYLNQENRMIFDQIGTHAQLYG
jgi:addiction module RelE/StbE family toxin